MKKYQKPSCTVLHIESNSTILLTGSLIGGEIGGVTDSFNARGLQYFDDDDEWE